MTESIELTQGIPWRGEPAALGLSNVFVAEDGGVRAQIAFLDGTDAGWEPDVTLKQGAIVPVAGQFMTVAEIRPGAQGARGTVHLQPLGDAGGIAAPDPQHLLLLEHGKSRTRDSWIAAVRFGPAGVTVERWPSDQARSRVAPAALHTQTLAAGDTLEAGSARYRVVRIQPPAGALLGFVELAGD